MTHVISVTVTQNFIFMVHGRYSTCKKRLEETMLSISLTILRTNVTGYTDETTMLPAFVMYGYMSHDDDTSGSLKLYFSEEFINIFNLQELNKRPTGNEDDTATIERAVAFNWATMKKIKFQLPWNTEKIFNHDIRKTTLKQSTYTAVPTLLEAISKELDILTDNRSCFQLYMRKVGEKVVIAQRPTSFIVQRSKKIRNEAIGGQLGYRQSFIQS